MEIIKYGNHRFSSDLHLGQNAAKGLIQLEADGLRASLGQEEVPYAMLGSDELNLGVEGLSDAGERAGVILCGQS